MSRKAFLVAILAVSTGLFGQRTGAQGGTAPSSGAPAQGTPTTQGAMGGVSGQAAAGQTQAPSANTAGTPTVPETVAGPAGTTGTTQANASNLSTTTSGINTGVIGGNVSGVPLLATPTATFDSPQPTAGITDAGRAGISSNVPINTGLASTLPSPTMVYTAVSPVNVVTVNPAAGTTPTAAGVAGSSGRMINDFGPSSFSAAPAIASGMSLGEVAAQLKASKGTANARMLTNDDVQKMVDRNTGVVVAKNMPPLGPGVPMQGGSQNSATQSATAQTAGAATGAQANAQVAQSSTSASQQTQTSSAGQQSANPASASAGQSENTQTTAGSTTPQINQNQQSNDTQGRSRLPATSTLLPMLGLLGIVSGGLGIWFRKFRR